MNNEKKERKKESKNWKSLKNKMEYNDSDKKKRRKINRPSQ